MIRLIDKSLTAAYLNAPTEDEIRSMVALTSPMGGSILTNAARALIEAKRACADRTPWRELVELHRQGDPIRWEWEIVDDNGTPREQFSISDRGFGLEGAAGLMFNAVDGMVKALDLIEAERKQKTKDSKEKLAIKHRPAQELKKWAVEHGRSSSLDEARRLNKTMPPEIRKLTGKLKDPERVIYDALRQALKRS
ncbi:MAG: hypothetical protein ACT6UH_22345 [Hydrogenophaga sp.]|uniref:hypothetical protein n=1 Tax=Hydrogenophaga sp. TaxID=1904254 RepID=UPI004036C772